MRGLVLGLALLFLPSCDILRDEAGYAGGYVGRVADDRLFRALAQKQRADRYLLTLVIVAPLAADLSQGSAQADAASTLINDAYVKLKLLYASAGDCLKPAQTIDLSQDCALNSGSEDAAASAFSFETHAFEMQRTMLSLTKQTLGAADLDDLADDIIDLDVIGILKAANDAVPVARRALAGYRDTVVTFADAINSGCAVDKCPELNKLIKQVKYGVKAETGSLVSHDQRVIRALLSELGKVSEKENSTWTLQVRHIQGLVYQIDRACASLLARQLVNAEGEIAADNLENCGIEKDLGNRIQPASEERDNFVETAVAKSVPVRLATVTTKP